MSNIDKRALREAANPISKRVWSINRDEEVVHIDDEGYENFIACAVNADVSSFIAAANPATVLALLDELEAKDKSISFLKDQLAQLANFNPDWDKLEAATDSLREHMAELTAARKRIAELEAREVKLPKLKMLSDYLSEVTHREREDILLGVKLEFHRELQAAGIRINGEG